MTNEKYTPNYILKQSVNSITRIREENSDYYSDEILKNLWKIESEIELLITKIEKYDKEQWE